MMRLNARSVPTNWSGRPGGHDVWLVADPADLPADRPVAALLHPGQTGAPEFALHLVRDDENRPGSTPTLRLSEGLDHVGPGDVIGISPDGDRVTVLWKGAARHNSLLLTEQCDHLCIMCSQPPKVRDDAWLFDRAKRVITLLPPDTLQVGLTGGEPTMHADRLIDLLGVLRNRMPAGAVHLLSNGRRFADPDFARRYAAVSHPGLMVGIPVYAPESTLHDWIVQARGAFDETLRGILALGGLHQRIELRVVIQASNARILPQLAEFISRNLPFVDQVALMGLEMTGLARANHLDVWIDPMDYQEELVEAAEILTASRVRTLIFNHQLCVLDERLHGLAVPSISDWKANFVEACTSCSLIESCGGVFATSGARVSRHLRPVLATV